MGQTADGSGGLAAVDDTSEVGLLVDSDSKKAPTGQHEVNNASAPQENDATAAATLQSEPCLQGIEFVQNLKNPGNLQPVCLPLQLKLFARIPVVVSARLFGQTGKPSETFAQLLIK